MGPFKSKRRSRQALRVQDERRGRHQKSLLVNGLCELHNSVPFASPPPIRLVWVKSFSNLFLGPAGWSYPDWAGPVYPRRPGAGFDDLRFLARWVSFAEVNASFYAPLPAGTGTSWHRRLSTQPKFAFSVKVWDRLTHAEEARVGRAELEAWARPACELCDCGRLLALLAQFPGHFRDGPKNRRHVLALRDRLDFLRVPLAVEVRHADFGTEAATAWFRAEGISRVQVDLPASAEHLGPDLEPTSLFRYLRFHGRNRAAWWSREAGRDARYDYLYSRAEVEGWVRRLRAQDDARARTLVVANNHFQGKALALVAELAAAWSGGRVSVPESLRGRYPSLDAIAAADPDTLFP